MSRKNRLLRQAAAATASSTPNQAAILFHYQEFSGPMPPPEMLRQYNEVSPGSADRIITMAEKQSAHRMLLERRVTTSNIIRAHIGQVFAMIIAVSGIAGGVYLIANNKPIEGLAAILVPIATIAGLFIYGRQQQQKELSSKNREIRR